MRKLLTRHRWILQGLAWAIVLLLGSGQVLGAWHLHEAADTEEEEEECTLCGLSAPEPILDCGGGESDAPARAPADCARTVSAPLIARPFATPLSRAPPIS